MRDGFLNRKKGRFAQEKSTPGHGWHSASYHAHFEDYAEYQTLNSRKKLAIKRIYQGDFYCQSLAPKQRIRLKFGAAALWLAALGLFICAGITAAAANTRWYFAVLQVAAIGLLFWTLTAVFNYVIAPAKMTVGDYKTGSRRLLVSSIITVGVMALCCLAYLVCALVFSGEVLAHLLCAGLCAAAALALLFLNRLEANVSYLQEKNGAEIPPDADAAIIE